MLALSAVAFALDFRPPGGDPPGVWDEPARLNGFELCAACVAPDARVDAAPGGWEVVVRGADGLERRVPVPPAQGPADREAITTLARSLLDGAAPTEAVVETRRPSALWLSVAAGPGVAGGPDVGPSLDGTGVIEVGRGPWVASAELAASTPAPLRDLGGGRTVTTTRLAARAGWDGGGRLGGGAVLGLGLAHRRWRDDRATVEGAWMPIVEVEARGGWRAPQGLRVEGWGGVALDLGETTVRVGESAEGWVVSPWGLRAGVRAGWAAPLRR